MRAGGKTTLGTQDQSDISRGQIYGIVRRMRVASKSCPANVAMRSALLIVVCYAAALAAALLRGGLLMIV